MVRSAEIRAGELVGDLGGCARLDDLPVQHDPGEVGDAEDLVRELFDDQDRQSGGGDPAYVVVQLLDDESARAPSIARRSGAPPGSVASARAIESICCSPPDRVPAVCLRRSRKRGKLGEHPVLRPRGSSFP